MKIIHQDNDQFILEDRPWLLGVIFVGMTLASLVGGFLVMGQGEVFGGLMLLLVGGGIPLLLAGVFVKRVRLTFDRQAGVVTRVQKSIFGLSRVDHPFSHIDRGVVVSSTDSDGTTYRLEVVLKDPDGRLPFTSYSTSGRRPQILCDALNRWLGVAP